jgi:hypothetical protein
MSIAENKAIFRRFVDEVMNQGKIAAIDELTAPDLSNTNNFHLEYRRTVKASNCSSRCTIRT